MLGTAVLRTLGCVHEASESFPSGLKPTMCLSLQWELGIRERKGTGVGLLSLVVLRESGARARLQHSEA